MMCKVEVISGVVRVGGVVGAALLGAVCDRVFTLLDEEAIEHICLVLRRSCLMWRVMEIWDRCCGFLLQALHDVVETSIASGVCRSRLDKY